MKHVKHTLKFFIVFVVIFVLIILLAGAYLYYFHVFKSVRICLGEEIKSEFQCDDNSFCEDLLMKSVGLDFEEMELPDFFRAQIDKLISENARCDDVCYFRNIKVGFMGYEIEQCDSMEKENLIELRGRELIDIYFWSEKNSIH